MDTLLFANSRLLTICTFFLKNAYLKWRHPDSFAVIKARVLSIRTTADAILNEQPKAKRFSQLASFQAGSVLGKAGSELVRSRYYKRAARKIERSRQSLNHNDKLMAI